MNTGLTRSETTPSSTNTTGLTQTDTFTQPYTSSTGQGLTTIVPTDTNATGPIYNYTTLQTPTNTTISNITSILPQNNSTSPSPTTIDVGNHTSTSFNYTTEQTTTSWDNLTTSIPSSSITRNRFTTTSQPTSVVTAVTFETTVHGRHLYRRCKKTWSWGIVDSDNCTRTELHLLKKKVEQIQQGNVSYTGTKDVLKKLVNETENSLTQGDVKAVVDIMDALANIASQKHPPDEEYLGNFVNITENVFNASADIWSSDTTLANRVLHAVEVIGVAAATNPSLNFSHVPVIATENIALKIGRSSGNEGIGFPDRSNAGLLKSWIQQSSTSAFLSVEAIPGNMTTVPYSAVLYRDLSQVLHVQPDALELNSAVLSFSLPTVNITEPIRLTFQHLKDALNSSSAPSCRFFQFGSD
ncbi:mucin-3B-like, partial [Littorina saxatilis]|uniref:mucin-3B-like n=1 Tax=Littorina saxatilis TaxID=31220 RepID=UPI0038B54CCE